jgi:hypothetical protein
MYTGRLDNTHVLLRASKSVLTHPDHERITNKLVV